MGLKRIAHKISWLTRRWDFTFRLFNLYLHDHDGTWGFNFLTFHVNFRYYSLLSLEFRLPNMTTVRSTTIDDWDFLYARNYLSDRLSDLDDRKMWGSKLTRWESLNLRILNKIFR